MECKYKVSVVGRSGVGKSSCVLRIMRGTFDNNHESTIGAAFFSKRITTTNLSVINLEFWDTAGQERYHSLIPMYTRGANIVILCIDDSNLQNLINDFKVYKLDNLDARIIVVITKIDTPMFNRDSFDKIVRYCKDLEFPIYFISSKTGEGIEELTKSLIAECLKLKSSYTQNINLTHKIKENKCCEGF